MLMTEEQPVVLDTHVWFWLATGNPDLSSTTRKLLESISRTGTIFIPAISMWEIAMLEKLGRIELQMPTAQWLTSALAAPGLKLAPLTPEIVADSCNLPGNFHKDPADQMIVATARTLQCALITRDNSIVKYGKQGHVKTISA